MNQNPNENAANSANNPADFPPGRLPEYPGDPDTAPPPGGGLKSALKVAVPLVALVGVVFGVTYLGMYTPPKDDSKDQKGGPQGNSAEPPLRFFTSARRWDPPMLRAPGYENMMLLAPSKLGSSDGDTSASFNLADRVFQGFYEPGGDESPMRRTQFWFENRNPNPVTMQLKGVSCTACSGGRLAAIPPEVTKHLLQHTAIASLPIGAFNAFGIGLVEPAANLTQLQWTEARFRDNPNATFHVPAATNPDKWSPQWGILELTFQVHEKPMVPLRAFFATHVDGTNQTGENTFAIMFEAAGGFELSRSVIDAGLFGPLDGDRSFELLVYSNTRGPGSEFGDLATPSCLIQTPPGTTETAQFVEVTKVQRIPDAVLVDLAARLANEQKRLTNVRAAYRVTIVVHPKVGENRLDVGQLERFISVSVPGVVGLPKQVTVKGLVRGSVWIDGDANAVELKTFRGANGHSEWVSLTTEKPGMELVVLKEECEARKKRNPADFDFVLEKRPDSGGQGHYRLKIDIKPGRVFGQYDGVVVLEVKGPNPQRIRIPFKGSSDL